jgi:hypothetical protein
MGKYDELQKKILEDGVIDANEVALLRKELYADNVIDREEADFLFALSDATSSAANDASWRALFVEALTDHVLKDEVSPGVLDEAEAAYLRRKIEADKVVDANELALLANITAKAKSMPASFNTFVLSSLKTAILEDGVIDAAEVAMLRTVIYGAGGAGGASVARSEADLLFELNDATSGKANHASWKNLFVEAISSHVLEDVESPGKIDDAEADWLISRIEKDGVYDENEKALLANIKAKATAVAGKLKAKLG